MIIILCEGTSWGNPGPLKLEYTVWDKVSKHNELLPPKFPKPYFRLSKSCDYGTGNEGELMSIIHALTYVGKEMRHKLEGHNQDIYIFSASQVIIKQINEVYAIREPRLKEMHNDFSRLKYKIENAFPGTKFYFQWLPKTFAANLTKNQDDQ